MSDFDFMKDKIEYAEIMKVCEAAEQAAVPAEIALKMQGSIRMYYPFCLFKRKC